MPRKRKRNRIRVQPWFWWALVVVNVCVGFSQSELTSARRIVVLGAEPFDHARIAKSLAVLKSKRWTDGSGMVAEAALLSLPDVETASVERNVFGRALVRLSYRKAVASVAVNTGVAMDRSGVLYPTKQSLKGLPVVRFEPGVVGTSGTLWTNWNSQGVADLCVGMGRVARHGPFEVLVQRTGTLCLNRVSGGRVVLGSHDALEAKLTALETILGDQPDLLQKGRVLNVTNPAGAVVGPDGSDQP